MIKIAFFDVDGTLLRLGHKELSANTAAVLRHYGFSADEVKAKADFVCKSVEDDGIYHYCIENKLIF